MTTLRTFTRRLELLGRARLRLALLVAALAATTLTLLTSLPAHAEPSPAPTPASPTVPTTPGQRTPTQEELEALEQFLKEQTERIPEAQREARLEVEKERLRTYLPDEGGVLGVFNVTDANNMPISAYTVRSDTGGMFDWDLGIQNLLTEFCFMLTKWLIAFACWFITWSLGFGLAKLLMAPVISVTNSLHTRVIMEMGLPTLFLAVCAVICVARILFGNKAVGFGDAALSLLLAALTTTLLASPPQVLLGEQDGALAITRGLALEVADVILDANPADKPQQPGPGVGQAEDGDASPATSSALSRPLTDALTDAFIVKPAMLLQYGRIFEGECAQAYADTKLAQLAYDRQITVRTNKLKKLTAFADRFALGLPVSGWYDPQIDMTKQWAVDHFGNPPMEGFEKKCVPGDVDAAKKASLDKLGGAFFLLVAAVIVGFLITGLAGSFLVAQCRIAWDAIRAEPALIAGTIPGAGRAFLWDWAASVMRRLGEILASVIALATFIIVVQALLDPVQEDWGRELTLRFLVVDVVCIAAVKKRKKLAARSKQIAAAWRAKMSAGRIGGTHGSAFTPTSTPVAKKRHLARNTARALVRTSLVGVSLAQGDPLAALGYAMPRTVGATVLSSRIKRGRRRGRTRPPARPSGRLPQRPPSRPGGSGSQSGGSGTPPRPTHPPQPAHPPRPSHPPKPSRPPRRRQPRTVRPANNPTQGGVVRPSSVSRTGRRQRPRPPATNQPAASARQQRLRQRLDSARRDPRRTPPSDEQGEQES